MRPLLYLSTVVLLIGCGALEAAPTAITAADTTQLRHIKEVLWPKAYGQQDTVLLDSILHAEFQVIDGDGNVSDKRGELTWIATNTWSPDPFFHHIERLDIFPNGTAIIAGMGHILSDPTETTYRSSNAFVRTERGWKAISSHVSGAQDKRR